MFRRSIHSILPKRRSFFPHFAGMVIACLLGWFWLHVRSGPHPPAPPFRHVDEKSEIRFRSDKGQAVNWTGDGAIVAALQKLKYGHSIIGRKDGALGGVMTIDGEAFRIEAESVQSGGYRAVVTDRKEGMWEGSELATLILSRYKYSDPIQPR